MDLNNNLEGKKTDNLEATSASEVIEGEEAKDDAETPEAVPELNNSPSPTEDEVKEADLNVETENVVPEEDPVSNGDLPPVANENVDLVHEENGVVDTPAMRTYTQDEYQNGLNDIAGKTRIETREKTFRYIYDRYGVNDEAGLDELIGNAQRYDSLQEQYDSDKSAWKEQSSMRDKELADVKEQVALMQSGIDSARYDDAKLILRGKGLEVSLDNINAELATHPEWKKGAAPEANPNFMKVDETKPQQELAEPASKISVLGNDNSKAPVDDEEAAAMRLFKV